MPRVPRYEAGVGTAPLRPPTARAPGDTGMGDLARGVSQVSQGLGAVAGSLDKVRQEEEAAQLIDAANALQAEFDAGFHDDENGLRRMAGEASYATGADLALKTRLQAKRAELLKALPSERARVRFERESTAALMGFGRTIEGYVGEQRKVASVSKLRAANETSLSALAGLDPRAENFAEEFERHAALIEMRTRELSPSREEAEADTKAWRARAHEVALGKLLEEDDTDAAKAYLSRAAADLGPKAQAYGVRIEKAALSRDADRLAGEFANFDVDEETGWKNERQALALLDTVKDPKMRAEVEPRLKEILAIEAKRKEADIRKTYGEAHTAYLKGGSLRAVPPKTRDWLERHAPDLWARLKDDANAKWRQYKADAASAKREKSQALIDARNELLSMPAEERAAVDLPTFAAGRGLDESGLKALGVDQRRAKDLVERGAAVGEGEFRRDALANTAGTLGKKDRKGFESAVTAAYNDFVEQHKRAPNHDEKVKLIDALTVTEVEKGWLFNGETPAWKRMNKERSEGRPVAAPAPAADAKPPERDRALALMRQGKSNAEVRAILDSEGY